MSQLEEMGIYVCASDGERKHFAPSGDTQGQRGIDGVNSEWQGAETKLLSLCLCVAFPFCLFLFFQLHQLTY